MSAKLLSFTRRRAGWDNEELALLVRVQRLLAGAGLDVEMEHGVSEEGDPWCVFCNAATGDVVVHIARIDGVYILDSSVLARAIEGRSLTDCADRFIAEATLVAPSPSRGGTFWIHPGAMFAGVLMTIMMFAQAHAERATFGEGARPGAEGDADDGPAAADRPAWLKLMAQQIAAFLAAQDRADRVSDQVAPSQNWVLLQSAAMIAALALHQDQKTLSGMLFGDMGEDAILLAAADTAGEAALPAEAEAEPAEDARTAEAVGWSPEEAAAEAAPAEAEPAEFARREAAEAPAPEREREAVLAEAEPEEQIAVRRGSDALAGGEAEDRLMFREEAEPEPQAAPAAAPQPVEVAMSAEPPLFPLRLVEALLQADARGEAAIADGMRSAIEGLLAESDRMEFVEAEDGGLLVEFRVELSGGPSVPPGWTAAGSGTGQEAAVAEAAEPPRPVAADVRTLAHDQSFWAYKTEDKDEFMRFVGAEATYGVRDVVQGNVIYFHPGIATTTSADRLLVIGYEHEDQSLSILITFLDDHLLA